MNPASIPAELKARSQWVVWKTVIREGGKATKPPFNPSNPNLNADVTDASTWGTFDQAMAVWTANRSTIDGIGYVFTDEDDYFGIDVDDERKVKLEFLERRRMMINQLLATLDTYTEVSPSGTGLHIIGKGKLPQVFGDGRRSTSLQWEIYQNKRFFTITGNVYRNRYNITDQQKFVDELGASVAAAPETTGAIFDTDAYRSTNLTDEEVIRQASNHSATFAPRFNGAIGNGPGEWSETFMALVGIIDRFTGSVEQAERIIMNSAFVRQSPPSSDGETRANKAARNFMHVLKRVRSGNNGMLYFIEHGRKQVENLQRNKEKRAREAAERMLSTDRALTAGRIMDAFPMLSKQHKELTVPPGVMGQFVEAALNASNMPFLKFAVPSTIAALAGVVGRGYKLPRGGGINVNFIVVAPSGIGKSQSADVWKRFMSQGQATLGTQGGANLSRFLVNGTASIQGIFEDFMAMPSVCWFIDECATQLKAMSNAGTPTEVQLRDGYNDLYDCARHDLPFQPPRSIANKKANFQPLYNLSVSTYWTTAPAKFDLQDADALDGFLSRVTIIRHNGLGGERLQYPDEVLPDQLQGMLVTMLANAKKLDETYQYSPHEAARLLMSISSDAIQETRWELLTITDKIRNASISGELPPAYTALSRLPITAERVAGVMAVLENPFTPAITQEQYLWAFGYLLQNALDLLGQMDSGEIGLKASDETLGIVRGMRSLMSKYKKPPAGVLRSDLRDHCVSRAPFNTLRKERGGASKMVTDTIKHMLEEGMLTEFDEPGATSKRRLLGPTNDPIWRM